MKLSKLEKLICQRDGLNKRIAEETALEEKRKREEEALKDKQDAADDEYKRIADGIRFAYEDAE